MESLKSALIPFLDRTAGFMWGIAVGGTIASGDYALAFDFTTLCYMFFIIHGITHDRS